MSLLTAVAREERPCFGVIFADQSTMPSNAELLGLQGPDKMAIC